MREIDGNSDEDDDDDEDEIMYMGKINEKIYYIAAFQRWMVVHRRRDRRATAWNMMET